MRSVMTAKGLFYLQHVPLRHGVKTIEMYYIFKEHKKVMSINRYGYTIDSIKPQPTLLTHTEIILYDINKQHTIVFLTLFFK